MTAQAQAADVTNTTIAPAHHRKRSKVSNPRLESSFKTDAPVANTTNTSMLEKEDDISKVAKPPNGFPDALTINGSGRLDPTAPTNDQVMTRNATYPARGFVRSNRPAAIRTIKRPRPYQISHSVTPAVTTAVLDAKALLRASGLRYLTRPCVVPASKTKAPKWRLASDCEFAR